MATTIGRHLINAGHQIVFSSSRGSEALVGLVADLGPAVSAGSKQEAAECDVVILATNWADMPEALKGIDWGGRILVDGTNAHMGEKRARLQQSAALPPQPVTSSRSNSMHVFVTGATGHVGSYVIPDLIAAGHEVTGLARLR
jgi:predicted dinucleotide-binding enzyme